MKKIQYHLHNIYFGEKTVHEREIAKDPKTNEEDQIPENCGIRFKNLCSVTWINLRNFLSVIHKEI